MYHVNKLPCRASSETPHRYLELDTQSHTTAISYARQSSAGQLDNSDTLRPRVAPHTPTHDTAHRGLNTQHTAIETPLTVCMHACTCACACRKGSMPRTGHMRRAAEATHTHTLPHRPPRLGHLALAAGRSRRPFLARPRSLLGTGSGRGVCRLVREWRSATKVAHASGLTRCWNPIADTYPVSIFVCCDDSQPGAVFESMCTRTTSTPCRRERGVSGTGLEDVSGQRRRRRRLLAQLLRRDESELDLPSACARHARRTRLQQLLCEAPPRAVAGSAAPAPSAATPRAARKSNGRRGRRRRRRPRRRR